MSHRRRRPSNRPSDNPREIAARAAERGVPEEQLQGPPARETLFLRPDREREVEDNDKQDDCTTIVRRP